MHLVVVQTYLQRRCIIVRAQLGTTELLVLEWAIITMSAHMPLWPMALTLAEHREPSDVATSIIVRRSSLEQGASKRTFQSNSIQINIASAWQRQKAKRGSARWPMLKFSAGRIIVSKVEGGNATLSRRDDTRDYICSEAAPSPGL
jgi:hypothetical protein